MYVGWRWNDRASLWLVAHSGLTSDDHTYRYWFKRSENKYWALFNGMLGIYYAHFNDGDDPEGAVENNRVHGFNSLREFRRLARKIKVPEEVLGILDEDGYRDDESYDLAMDKLLLFLDEKILTNKNVMMFRQVLRTKSGTGRSAAERLSKERF